MNKIILVGRLCHDPELKYLGEKNVAVTRFTLAVNRDYKNSQGNYETDFINCEIWNKQAEIFSEYMTKGRLVYVEGELKIDQYVSSNGDNKKSVSVRCNLFKFIDSKQKENINKSFNGNEIFTEEVFEGEIAESEIPF